MTLLSSVAFVTETPVDAWLAEQADLTAVERFAQRHEGEVLPRQARYYRDLIPLSRPQPGQQYAFDVDLDACTGCKACVAACHRLNGLDDAESWRSVTLLTGRPTARPVQQTVTAACHHCLEPACLKGCPVDAYEKDATTGIVHHLDDQCIGCSYCTLSCPYEVPVYNPSRGIVRKCDMCAGRLAVGEAPACVQACPNGAIAIRIVDASDAVAASERSDRVPGGPPSAITVPTTTYRTNRREVDELVHAPEAVIAPSTPHPSLAVMLVLTQLAVGAFVVDLLLRYLSTRTAGVLPVFDAVVVAAAATLALAASVLHLGRPWHCYRAVIGLRHSWLSREVVAFAAFTTLAVPYCLLLYLDRSGNDSIRVSVLGLAVACAGTAGVACSVLIYSSTRRRSWRAAPVAARFALTAAVCGVLTVLWAADVSTALGLVRRDESPLANQRTTLLLVAGGVLALGLAGQARVWLAARRGDPDAARRLHLLTHDLRTHTVHRFVAGAVAGVALPLFVVVTGWPQPGGWSAVVVSTLMVVGVVHGEMYERSLFFTTASRPQ